MVVFDTGDVAVPYPSLPGTFKGRLMLNEGVTITKVTTSPMKGTTGAVRSYKIIDPITKSQVIDLSPNVSYNLEVRLSSYPRYFHNIHEIRNEYGSLTYESFIDSNGRGRMWIPVLKIEGASAAGGWVTLTQLDTGVCMVGEAIDADLMRKIPSAEVYVDGVYIHAYAPETIHFCTGCMCGTYVDCGFGTHTISVRKKGYAEFSQLISVNAGDVVDVEPILRKSEEVYLSSPTSAHDDSAVVHITLFPEVRRQR